MIAYKWLRTGRVSPFAGCPWPAPGNWLEGRPRVSACSPEHLSRWIGPELWLVELAGDVRAHDVKLSARRGRLVERVDAWDPVAFADRCAAFTATDPGYVAGAAGQAALARAASDPEEVAVCAACAAHHAACAGGTEEAFRAAHATFSAWIAGA